MTYYDPTAEQQVYEYQQQQQQQADNQWKSVEKQHQGGSTPGQGGFSTDFESHGGGLKGLRNMIMSTDPEALHNVASRWTAIHDSLHETAGQLKTHVNNLLENWSGDSAEAFRTNAGNLHTSLTNGAQYAQNASSAMSDAAFALQDAKNTMPDEPGLWDRGSRALTSERQDWQFKQDAAQYGLEAAVKKDGGQLSANEEAHQKAVVVMEKLGTKYNEASAKLDERPVRGGDGGVWPPAPSKTYTPVGSSGGSTTSPKHEAMVNGQGGDTTGHGGVTGVRDPGTGGTTHNPTDPTGGIHGGNGGGNLHNPTTTIDGGPGGPHSGGGINNNNGGDPNYHGVGFGDGHGGGTTNGAHEGLYGGMGPLGAGGGGEGGVLGGGRRGGRLGGAGGEAGMGAAAESEEALAARNARLAAAKERAAAEAASGERGGTGMGMGMGGLGRGNSSKKKRKARAGYLVEDEETWDVDGDPNPNVIDF